MLEITRHMDGRTAVIGATVTKVPATASHLPMTLDDVPVDVWYVLDDEGPDTAWVLVNGLDVHCLLAPEHQRAVSDAVYAADRGVTP